ncbi:MAG: stage sporulation protein [Clostridiales bacterium]|jgi:stage II sporulation protein D|nr:stage sporulation protein [Clostridiales bacterium]MDK2933895.1 stage sporulation protein [Clostridiales bacterium]
MKQLGYVVLFMMIVIILIPLVLVKGCGQNSTQPKKQKTVKKTQQIIKVYIAEEDKVVDMNFNEYLKGVVAAEMPASFNIEALKAQAVAARTYVYYRLINYKKSNIQIPEHKGADICTNPAHCKAWISKSNAMEKWGLLSANKYWNKISKAVDDTTDRIIIYNDEPIDAVFHSTSSGKTENSEDVWANVIPYLRSVPSQGEQFSPKYISKVELPIEEFKEKLREAKPEIKFKDSEGDLSVNNLVENLEHTEGGSVKTIRIGGCDFKGTEIRRIFELNSAHFSLDIEGNNIVFNVKGNGHGVGMSQYGANYLAEQGKDYEEILKYYYKDIKITQIDETLQQDR